jgi:hypothetical protein
MGCTLAGVAFQFIPNELNCILRQNSCQMRPECVTIKLPNEGSFPGACQDTWRQSNRGKPYSSTPSCPEASPPDLADRIIRLFEQSSLGFSESKLTLVFPFQCGERMCFWVVICGSEGFRAEDHI